MKIGAINVRELSADLRRTQAEEKAAFKLQKDERKREEMAGVRMLYTANT